jgi:hypothetical protein
MLLKDFRHIDPDIPLSLINPSQGKLQIKSDGTIKGSMEGISDGQTLEQLISNIRNTVR